MRKERRRERRLTVESRPRNSEFLVKLKTIHAKLHVRLCSRLVLKFKIGSQTPFSGHDFCSTQPLWERVGLGSTWLAHNHRC